MPFVHREREHFEAPPSTTQLYFVSFSFISCLKIKILFLKKSIFELVKFPHFLTWADFAGGFSWWSGVLTVEEGNNL